MHHPPVWAELLQRNQKEQHAAQQAARQQPGCHGSGRYCLETCLPHVTCAACDRHTELVRDKRYSCQLVSRASPCLAIQRGVLKRGAEPVTAGTAPPGCLGPGHGAAVEAAAAIVGLQRVGLAIQAEACIGDAAAWQAGSAAPQARFCLSHVGWRHL